MYHNKKGRRLGRRLGHRTAMLRNLAISLIEEERIETTTPRAKELRRFVEPLVTHAKRGDLHARRLIVGRLGNNPEAAEKLIDDIAPRYDKRPGGYTRVLKTGFRRGDAASTAIIEWVEVELPKRKKRKSTKSKVEVEQESTPDEVTESNEDEAVVETEVPEEVVAESATDAATDEKSDPAPDPEAEPKPEE